MQAKELIDKALEIQQLQWWLAHPSIKSFHLSVEHDGDDEGHFYKTVENRTFDLTTDTVEDPDFNDDDRWFDYENHSSFSTKSYYPVDINKSHHERIYRPYSGDDMEIQARVNHILYTLTFDGTP